MERYLYSIKRIAPVIRKIRPKPSKIILSSNYRNEIYEILIYMENPSIFIYSNIDIYKFNNNYK